MHHPDPGAASILSIRKSSRLVFALLWLAILAGPICAQMETARLSGQITDPAGRVVPKAEIKIVNLGTGVASDAISNEEGIYSVTGLIPGRYRVTVHKDGFREVIIDGLVLNVQDVVAQNVHLELGSVAESITVTANQNNINTQDASVSTVVDRQFAENLPLNGRSFQSLIELTPGVVLTQSTFTDPGQFSVNGQRAGSNYWMVDGVSADIGVSATGVSGLSGGLGAFSAQGGTNSLVSVDALQEFRIETSTYAPEFGRTPGAQISIVTRSGTNQFHGTVFDYLRNDVFDANNWFADRAGLPKPEERQNDFGGVLGGPIIKDRTFFFFSYEGLRLRLPQTELTTVPDLLARQAAVPAMQPFLDAFPFASNQPDLGNGVAQFDASFSNPSTLDAYSVRIDHKLRENLTLFGRYNYSPSQIEQRGTQQSLSTVSVSQITTQTATLGATWSPSSTIVDDLRFNYSRVDASSHFFMDDFGGAEPLTSLPFPSPFTNQNGIFSLTISSLQQGVIASGKNVGSTQNQINVIDSLSSQKGSHSLKFGVDFRRLFPTYDPTAYDQTAYFNVLADAENGIATGFNSIIFNRGASFSFRDLGLYAQDTWRAGQRVTITYGVRWDVEFVPQSTSGPGLPAVRGFDLNNLSELTLAPAGTSPYKTTYNNFAPRIGLAYQISQSRSFATVLRGGFGVFYDLAGEQVSNNLTNEYPFGAVKSISPPVPFPYNSATAAPPAITPSAGILAFDPNLKLPYTLQWNIAIEQALGNSQTLSASYIGSTGRRLIGSGLAIQPTPTLGAAFLVANASTSDYDALQVQFKRRLAAGLQALASYTWSHSIDDGSVGSIGVNAADTFLPSTGVNSNRGPSDFDIRNAFSMGVTYDISIPKMNPFATAILRGWSVENFVLARSAPPVDLTDGNFSQLFSDFTIGNIRPDLVPGEPLYLYGSQYPGGKAFNPAAFADPPTDPNTGFTPLRQGDASRNMMRGFGAAQWDFAVHREFPLRESLHLQFRAEMFNLLNHPNFAPPSGCFGLSCTVPFGVSTQTLGQYLSGNNVGGGGFSPLYQIGGPRSIQFALKLNF
jgi:hypothetical protein